MIMNSNIETTIIAMKPNIIYKKGVAITNATAPKGSAKHIAKNIPMYVNISITYLSTIRLNQR